MLAGGADCVEVGTLRLGPRLERALVRRGSTLNDVRVVALPAWLPRAAIRSRCPVVTLGRSLGVSLRLSLGGRLLPSPCPLLAAVLASSPSRVGAMTPPAAMLLVVAVSSPRSSLVHANRGDAVRGGTAGGVRGGVPACGLASLNMDGAGACRLPPEAAEAAPVNISHVFPALRLRLRCSIPCSTS